MQTPDAATAPLWRSPRVLIHRLLWLREPCHAWKRCREHVLAIHEHDGRLVSGPTKWWVEHAPNGYRYYCIHAVSLDVECDKCKRKVMRFERKAT